MNSDQPGAPEASRAHTPVLLSEAIDALEPVDGGLYVDATFGAGGYSRALLSRAACRVLAIDQDPSARGAGEALKAASGGRLVLVEASFSGMDEIVAAASDADTRVDGVVMDVGVSSMQLDQAERGFSFRRDGPLDMRMRRSGASAADVVAILSAEELASVFYVYGEERRSRRIAAAVVAARQDEPLTRTSQLAALVERAIGTGDGRIHPATRVFQALRIYVNDELGQLAEGLASAERVLRPGGRLVVVSFHSLEDRLVKTFLRTRAKVGGGVSRHAPGPIANDEEPGSFRLVFNGARTAGAQEIADNPRARSAKLRAGARTSAPAIALDPALAPRPAAPRIEALEARI